MAQLIVRNLDEDVKAKLASRARRHQRSTEEEVRDILRTAVLTDDEAPSAPLGTQLAACFSGLGVSESIEELRGETARPADLDS